MTQTQNEIVRTVIAALPEPAFILGPGGQVVFANAEFAILTGADFTGQPVSKCLPDVQKLMDAFVNHQEGDQVDINVIPQKDGHDSRRCLLKPLRLRLDDGQVAFLLHPQPSTESAIFTDESAETMGSYFIDIRNRTCSITSELQFLTGLHGADGVIKLSQWYGMFNKDDLDSARSQMKTRPGQTTQVLTLPLRLKDKTGTFHYTRHDIHILECDEQGKPLRFNGIVYRDTRPVEKETYKDMDAVASVDLNIWYRDLKTDHLHLKGPLIERLGLGAHDQQIEISREEWMKRIHPDDLDFLHAESTRHINEGGESNLSFRIRDASGKYIRIRARGMISEQSSSGEPLKISGYSSEVSDADWYRDRFDKSKTDLSRALRDAGISTWLFDMRKDRIRIDGPVIELLGLGNQKTITTPEWVDLVHPDDMPIIEEAIINLNKSGTMQIEFRLNSRIGDIVWVQMWGSVIARDKDGWTKLVSCFSIDITERKALEAELDFEKDRLKSIYGRTPALMRSLHSNGHDLMVSDYWTQVTGYSNEESLAQPIWYFAHPDDQARLKDELIGQLFKDGQITRQPVRIKTKTGDVLETRLSGFVEDSQSGEPVAHCVFEDVTDLNRARKDIEAYANELERTNRELDRFATVASHDLQEPLRKIAAFASLLKRRYEGQIDPEADQSLDYLVDAAGRMRHLIDDLLTYSRTSSRALEHQPLDLNRLLKEVVSALGVAIEEAGASIQIPSLPEILADPTLISLLFQNLISNAIKYRQADKPPQISISAEAIGRDWRFKVEDNGIGLEERFKEKIFAPFQRLHSREEYEGTGIGLAISQQAVERHGGRIWVDSEPGIGSKFYFTLPRQVENIAVA